MSFETNRREFLNAVLSAVAASGLPLSSWASTGASTPRKLPLDGIRVIEKSETLTGRLTGLLLADQGAEVFVGRANDSVPDEHDEFLDRNKFSVAPDELMDTGSADVIIVDGDSKVDRLPAQVVMRVTAALPGDTVYGHLPADCSEDLLNAITGFYTDMGITGPILGRPVIYTPLPLCSTYAGVLGATATLAALIDRERCGKGREVIASRLAGGLAAIGALALTSEGLPDHLKPADLGGVPEGADPEAFRKMLAEAAEDPEKQRQLENLLIPMASFYRSSDGRLVMPLSAPNRRLTKRFLTHMGIWDKALEAGLVDVDPYDPANINYIGRNLGDPFSLNFQSNSILAELIEPEFAKQTADELVDSLNAQGIPCTLSISWKDWQNDPDARAASVFAHAKGHEHVQLGRPSWVASAQPYPDLEACRQLDALPARKTGFPKASGNIAKRPLEGYVMLDLASVIAGPSCGRAFAELGATVVASDPINPQHSPLIMLTWQAELGVGKRSIILDVNTEEGRKILNQLLAKSDLFMNNGLDPAFERLGLDPASLARINPSTIGVQLSAYKGEKPARRDDWPGYDPIAQAATGIMDRFGPQGCPTPHGVASCVDYLCGYLGAWAGVVALLARERRKDGKGDWAETSLVQAGSLTQLLLQQTPEPASARGPFATGMNEGERVYQLSDGWIFVQGNADLSEQLKPLTVAAALTKLDEDGIAAVPILTVRELADKHRDEPTKTVDFEMRESGGWSNECFAPSWFAFDGERVASPGAPSRIGADAPTVLAELGYSTGDLERLIAKGVVGQTEWAPID